MTMLVASHSNPRSLPMSATGIPTPRLRLIRRGSDIILQQHTYITFNIGETKERSRWVWMDIPVSEIAETDVEIAAREEVEKTPGFTMAANQLIR
jgi:hypothetical protein